MWEKCVGCGEGLFAGDAFCGNCGRPVTPSVPAAREPDGLESAPLAAPADDPGQVRIIPTAHHPGAPEQARPEPARPEPAARPEHTRPEHARPGHDAPTHDAPVQDAPAQDAPVLGPGVRDAGMRSPGAHGPAVRSDARAGRTGRTAREDPAAPAGPGRVPVPDLAAGTARRNRAIRPDSFRPDNAGRRNAAAARGAVARPARPRLSGPGTLDPVRNPRYLMYILRQAGVFTGIYLLTEMVLLLCVLLSVAAGTKLGPAVRLEMDSLWLVALVLGIAFWLIPVPALLAEWTQVMEESSDATQTAFGHINSAFQAYAAPVDSVRLRTASRPGEGHREYLELRRGHFSGYISCFAHEHDLYVGWTFWLHMSPLRLLMMVIGRNLQDVTSRGDGIYRSLRFESTRALVAAMHGAALAGIDAASSEPDQVDPRRGRETAIDMNFRVG
jgi:hypothetical protein